MRLIALYNKSSVYALFEIQISIQDKPAFFLVELFGN